MQLIRFFALTLCLVILSWSNAEAQFRVATIDVNRVLNEAKVSTAKKKELDKLTLEAKKKVESRREQLQAVENKIKSGTIKAESKEAEQFRVDAREFSRFVKDTQDDLKREFLKTNKDLTEQVLATVQKFAQEKKLDLVLDKSEEGRGAVLFGAPGADITDEIIARLNS